MPTYTSYSEKLKDPRWQRKRLEILKRDDFTCQCCFSTEKTLQVHHLYYVSKREPWNYPAGAYLTLCYECHKEIQDDALTKVSIWETDVEYWEGVRRKNFGMSPVFSFYDYYLSDKMNTPFHEFLCCFLEMLEDGLLTDKDFKDWQERIERKRNGNPTL